MKKRLTVLICNDMRDPSDPIVVTVSGATPEEVRASAIVAHAEEEVSDFDGDPLTAADLWEVSQAWIMAVICALLDVVDAAPLCTMGE